LRRDLFRHLMGHSPSYFADRLPGMLTSRVTATSNAVFTAENMFTWNVLPPCVATIAAIALVVTISLPMAGALAVVAGIMVGLMFRWRRAGRPLHHDFAGKAAAVDGEMVDVVTNMPLVRAFGGFPARASPLSTPRSTAKWTRGGAACSIWRSCASFTPSSRSY
jgi:ATP-binding cassette subfamily B protein